MFRKIVSNLPFSPSLVGQLGFYARRLKKEQLTRKLGLVFTVLALVVQSFAIFSPPEPANAASSADFVRGGVRTMNEMLSAYDSSNDLRDIFAYAGITREEIANARNGTVNSKGLISWGRTPHFSAAQGEVKHVIPRSNGGTSTVYSRPLALWDTTAYTRANGSTYDAFIGHSASKGWFAIIKNCANLVTEETPEPTPDGAIEADCDVIRGFAYDGRRLDMKVKVTLYAGGPPGSGEKIGTVTANQASPNAPNVGGGHGFSLPVPEKFKQSDTATPVYGVMTPLPGWTSSTVNIGSASIPPNCNPQPVAECTQLTIQRIDRTRISMTAAATTENGATVSGYTFTIRDGSGAVIDEHTINSAELSTTSGEFDLPPGEYTAAVAVQTSLGERTGGNCETPISIAEPERCPLSPELEANDPRCQPCPGDESIWIEDERCTAQIVQGKEAANLTRNGENANGTTVQASDRIEYTIYVENIGLTETEASIEENLKDVLEYSSLHDNGGGNFDEETGILSWKNVTLQPGERQTRKFVVVLHDTIPATPQGVSEPTSYDCKMTNTFGNTIEIDVDCPLPKGIEQTVTELPKTGPGENLLFAGAVLAIAAFFYARSRLMSKEVRLIRKEYNTGTI